MSTGVRIVGLGFLALLAVGLALWIIGPWFAPRSLGPACTAQSGDVTASCYEQRAKVFLEKDYAEAKDLAKTFLTLLSALLVASITFSEKIVDVRNAGRVAVLAIISCWFLLLLAIVLTGAGLATMAVAAGVAAYSPEIDYFSLEWHAVQSFILGCLAFGGALLALITAGLTSLLEKRSKPPA